MIIYFFFFLPRENHQTKSMVEVGCPQHQESFRKDYEGDQTLGKVPKLN